MSQEQILNDILEVVEFIRDNAVMKEDLRLEIQRLDIKIDTVKQEMIEHVDGFIALYQKHEVELAAVVSRQERVEEKLNKIIKHLGLELA